MEDCSVLASGEATSKVFYLVGDGEISTLESCRYIMEEDEPFWHQCFWGGLEIYHLASLISPLDTSYISVFHKLYNLEGEQKSSSQQHWRTDQRARLQGRWQNNLWLQVIIWANLTYGHSLPFHSGVVVFDSVTKGVTRSLTFCI